MSDEKGIAAKGPPRSTWNFRQLTVALIIGGAFQAVFLPCLCSIGTTKGIFAFCVDVLIVLRMLVALILGEKNRGWVFYCVLCYTSVIWIEAIFWLAVERH